MTRGLTNLLFIVLVLAVQTVSAQEPDNPESGQSLAEIDHQLNNPLTSLWSLTFKDNVGAKEGDLVNGRTATNVLFFQPALPIPIGEEMVFIGRPILPLVVRPESFGEVWNVRFQITPVINSPFN